MRCFKFVIHLAVCLLSFHFILNTFVIAQSASQPKSGRQSKPNMLIILADDLGYGDLSSYGAKDMRTPNIDALIASGMRFDNFYANSTVCSPSRAALMTGRYPDLVGVPGVIREDTKDSWGYLSPRARLLPHILKENNYHTALIGKWHLGLESPNLPNNGKDYYAVRRGSWKFMQNYPYMPFRLYNLANDPLEQHDVVKENPKIVEELSALLREHLQQAGAVPWQKTQ